MRPTTAAPHAATAIAVAVRPRPVCLLGAAQLVLGTLLTLRPEPVAAFAAGEKGRPAPRWLVRVLGLRSAAQGAVMATTPTRTVLIGGALIDFTHAASMLLFIATAPRYRRAATISACTAGLSAAAAASVGHRQPDREQTG